MSDDQSPLDPRPKSWIDKIAQYFSDEPTDTKSLLELIRNAEQDKVLDADALSIIEGAAGIKHASARYHDSPHTSRYRALRFRA